MPWQDFRPLDQASDGCELKRAFIAFLVRQEAAILHFGELEKVCETPIESFFLFFLLRRTASSKQTSCLLSKTRHGVHLFTPGTVTASRFFAL